MNMLNLRGSPLFVNLAVRLLCYSCTCSKCVMFACSRRVWGGTRGTLGVAARWSAYMQSRKTPMCLPAAAPCTLTFCWVPEPVLLMATPRWGSSVIKILICGFLRDRIVTMKCATWPSLNLPDLRWYAVVLFTFNASPSTVGVLARLELQVAVLVWLEISGAQTAVFHTYRPALMWWMKHMINSYSVFECVNQTFCKCTREAKPYKYKPPCS